MSSNQLDGVLAVRRIAERISDLNGRLSAFERSAQLGFSSVAGSLTFVDEDGNEIGTIGAQNDGTTAFVVRQGPPPPKPAAPTVTSILGGLQVSWSGLWDDADSTPSDFARMLVHIGGADDFTPDASTLAGVLLHIDGGDTATIALNTYDQVWVRLVATTTSGATGEPSEPVAGKADKIAAVDINDFAVGFNQITDGAVHSTKIAVDGVQSAHITDGAVVATKLVDGAVISSKLADAAVVTSKLASGSVTAGKVGFAIGGGNLLSNSGFENTTSTTNSIAGWTRTGSPTAAIGSTNPRYGTKTLDLSGAASSGTDAYVSQSVPCQGGKAYTLSAWVFVPSTLTAATFGDRVLHLGASPSAEAASVTVAQGAHTVGAWTRYSVTFTSGASDTSLQVRLYSGVGNDVIRYDGVQLEEADLPSAYAPRPDEILPGTVGTTEIADDSISSPKIIADAVVAGKIAADAVSAREIVANTITANEIAADTITAAQIAANTITANEMTADSITAREIAALSITAAELAAGAVTANKLAIIVGGGNKLPNAGFEAPTITGWSPQSNSSIALSTADKFSGTKSLLVSQTSNGTNTGTQYSATTVVGETYTFSARVKRAAGAAGVNITTDATSSPNGFVAAPTGWSRISVTFVASSTTTQLKVYNATGAGIPSSTGTGNAFYLDEVQLEIGDVLTAWAPKTDEILPGTIVASMIAADTITANEIAASAITATELAAGAVTANKLAVIAGGGNTFTNASFEADTDANAISDDWAIYNNSSGTEPTTASRPTGRRLIGKCQRVTWSVVNTSTKGISRAGETRDPDTWYVISVYARASLSSAGKLALRWNNSPTTIEEISNPVLSATVWQRYAWRVRWASGSTIDPGTFITISADGTPASVLAATGYVEFDDAQHEEGDTLTGFAPKTDEVLPGTIVTTMIATDAITADKILAGAIGTDELAANAVTANKILAGEIGTNHLAAGAVTAAKIAAGTITANEIAAGTITATELAANAVTAAKIAATAIDGKTITGATIIGGVVRTGSTGDYIRMTSAVKDTLEWVDGDNADAIISQIRGRIGNFSNLGGFYANTVRSQIGQGVGGSELILAAKIKQGVADSAIRQGAVATTSGAGGVLDIGFSPAFPAGTVPNWIGAYADYSAGATSQVLVQPTNYANTGFRLYTGTVANPLSAQTRTYRYLALACS